MSNRPAIIALFLTLLLAAAAWLVLRPAPGGAGAHVVGVGERVLTMDSASMDEMTLVVPPSAGQTLQRRADGRWWWRSSQASAQWYALDDARARALVRLLAEAKGVATPRPGEALAQSPAPVELSMKSQGGSAVLKLSPRALGGQVLAEVSTAGTTRAAIVSEDLLAVLTSPGPTAWRDTRALPVDPGAASKIVFTDGAGTSGFGLERRGGQWFLAPPAPVNAPAESEPVAQVIRLLGSLNITRFFDGPGGQLPTAEAAGLDRPTAVLSLEFEDRSVDPATQKAVVSARTVTLKFGQPADTQGSTLYASADGGQTLVAVDAVQLTKLTVAPNWLVMKAASRVPPADVGSLAFKAASGSRSLRLSRDSVSGKWSETLDAGSSVTLDPVKAGASESLIVFFTGTGADSVTFDTPPEAKLVSTVELLTPGDQPLERFDLLLPATGGGLLVRSGGVCRLFGQPPEELLGVIAKLSR